MVERQSNLWIKLIFVASSIQFCSFYYMIFHVDWLGTLWSYTHYAYRLGHNRADHLLCDPANSPAWPQIFHEEQGHPRLDHHAGDLKNEQNQ